MPGNRLPHIHRFQIVCTAPWPGTVLWHAKVHGIHELVHDVVVHAVVATTFSDSTPTSTHGSEQGQAYSQSQRPRPQRLPFLIEAAYLPHAQYSREDRKPACVPPKKTSDLGERDALRILGSPRHLCDGWTRRDFIQASTLGAIGLGTTTGAASQPTSTKARACILLYLYGSPSQLETFDVKPNAPIGVRGELGTTATSVPGFRIGELLPETAKVIDRATVVRSLTHPYPVHGIAYATTGLPDPGGTREVSPRDPAHWPFIGGSVDRLPGGAEVRGTPPAVPNNLALPWPLSTRRANQPHRAGPYGGFLGPAYDPIWTEFRGEGTRAFTQENRGVVQEFRDPYGGIRPDGRFEISTGDDVPLTLNRLDLRRTLLEQLDFALHHRLDSAPRAFDRYRGMAYSMLTSDRLRTALERPAGVGMRVRESYLG